MTPIERACREICRRLDIEPCFWREFRHSFWANRLALEYAWGDFKKAIWETFMGKANGHDQ